MKDHSNTWIRVVMCALASLLFIAALFLVEYQQTCDSGSAVTDRFSERIGDEGVGTDGLMSAGLVMAAASDASLMADDEEANEEEKEEEDKKGGDDTSDDEDDGRIWDRVKRG